MKLAAKAICPLHGRRDCCGRTADITRPTVRKKGIWTFVRTGVWKASDGRERCSTAEKRRRKDILLKENPTCAACGERFTDYRQVELAHRKSKGIGGGKIDDSWRNLTLLHFGANRAQGSMDLEVYLRDFWKPEHCHV